jgi:hypothetical protein
MNDQQIIQGKCVVLRPATPKDEPQILESLQRSDVTPLAERLIRRIKGMSEQQLERQVFRQKAIYF